MEPEDLVRILLTVPGHRLAIFDLTWQLMGEDGDISPDAVAFHAQALHTAAEEVRAHRRNVTALTEALAKCQ